MYVVIEKCVYFIENKYSFLVLLKTVMLLLAVVNEFLEPERCFTMTTLSDIRTPQPAVAAPFSTRYSHTLAVQIPCIHETQMFITLYK
jgi:hypothetical protein